MAERDPISGSSRDYGAIAAPPTVGFADFSPTELYNLSEGIADNVNTINSGLRSLEKMMKQIGGPNDNLQLRDKIMLFKNENETTFVCRVEFSRASCGLLKGSATDSPTHGKLRVSHDTQQTVNGSVSATARDIQRLGVVARRGDKPQKLQVERLTQAFKDALAKYSSVQKQVSEKMAAHMPKQARNRNDPSALERQAIADDEESALLDNQQAQARLVQFETNMLLEREQYIHKIEADVLDVNQIMQDLASLVQQQGQTVDTVESHIEAASSNVESGVDELAKAEQHQRSYRKKMFILIIIGIIVGIIFIVWIVKAFR